MTDFPSHVPPEEQQAIPTSSVDVWVDRQQLYHGSPVAGIEALDKAVESTVGKGVYFTPDPESAIGYARHRTKGTEAQPVIYIAEIEHARLADLRTTESIQAMLLGFGRFLQDSLADGTDRPWYFEGAMQSAIDTINRGRVTAGRLKNVTQNVGGEFSKYLRGQGYDGLIALEGGEGGIGNHESYVIFDPTEVRIVSRSRLTSSGFNIY